ncbi:MAG: multicopper oxidase type 3, partial [bacterium]|nr:multicopper oxidase type 3 [bacterium]
MYRLFAHNRRLSTVAVVAPLLMMASCTKPNPAKTGTASAVPSGGLVQAIVNVPGTSLQLTAQRMSIALRDGSPAPMWGFCANSGCSGTWAPGPTIVAQANTSLTIELTNALPVPTSLVILGQIGGGVGSPAKMTGPAHTGQTATTFPGNAPAGGPTFVPPKQGQRVRSFGTEVAAKSVATLSWPSLKPGTYIYETGTLPSLQVPMGLYGVLIVTDSPTDSTPGTAYPAAGPNSPAVSYDAEATLLFSELDVVQNSAVDAAAQAGRTSDADFNVRFNDPSCTDKPCYPAAVNYAPTYFLINGRYFDPTSPQKSALDIAGTFKQTGNVLVRLANAGSRTHVPSLVGTTMALVAEDGNRAPGNPKLQTEVLLTAGKTHDVLVNPAGSDATSTSYPPATMALFDRALNLSSGNMPIGGMQAFLLVNRKAAEANGAGPGDPGMLPVAVVPAAIDDAIKVPYNTATSGNVTANDIAVSSVEVGTAPANGTVTLNRDGSFTYQPNAGYSGTDTFTYFGNGHSVGPATVTLTVAAQLTGAANTPHANADSYVSNIATKFSAPRPGVLANDSDPHNFPLTASLGPTGTSTCGSVALNADGSFSVTGNGGSCQFSYSVVNSQGTSSDPATVTVTFGTASNLNVSVTDAKDPTVAIADYRWTLQEDLTFKHDT